jgi:methyl-accepting chemotaxis protein|tara:strand:+ start:288 stop:1109 length:822 start_codon:yes stop_codon:yes gene_type:complete
MDSDRAAIPKGRKGLRFKGILLGGINRKLILAFILVSIIPIMVITYISFNSEIGKQALEQTHLDSLESIADLKVNQIENFFEEREEDIKDMQNDFGIKVNLPKIKEHIDSREHPDFIKAKQQLDSELKPFQQSNEFLLDVLLLDTNGNIMYVTGNVHKDDELGIPFPREDVIEEGKSHIHFTEVFESPFFEDGFEILLSAPVYDFDNRFIGVVVFGIDMQSIYDLIEDRTGLGETGETLIGRKMISHMGVMKDGHMVERAGDHALFLNPLRHD